MSFEAIIDKRQPAVHPQSGSTGFEAILLDKLPVHDTTWSLTAGMDGLIYIGVCGETTGGLSAYIASYNPDNREVHYLLEVASAVSRSAGNGRPTHGKVHYCLLPGEGGILYAATHCTCPPAGDFVWRPWHTWSHPSKAFDGSKILAYDTKKNEVLFADDLLRGQGTRCMAINRSRRLIYGISYPKDHYFVYDIDGRMVRDYGRIGSINPQCIFLDRAGNGYTTNDYGFLVRFNVEAQRLEELEVQIPHASFRNGFHTVPYDAVASPDGRAVYGVTWDFESRLFRYYPDEGPQGRMEDLGKAFEAETALWGDIKDNHAGGLVVGPDDQIYFTVHTAGGVHLIRLNPGSLEREDLGAIHDGDIYPDLISRAARDRMGNLYFAEVGKRPTKLFVYRHAARTECHESARNIIRNWG